MQVKVKVEAIGSIISSPKGFICEYLAVDPMGKKCVLKVFSKNEDDLKSDQVHEKVLETDNFCFLPKAA